MTVTWENRYGNNRNNRDARVQPCAQAPFHVPAKMQSRKQRLESLIAQTQ